MEGLCIGRVVHYVLNSGIHVGEHRMALVSGVVDKEVGIINVQVVSDGPGDGHPLYPCGLTWMGHIRHDDDALPGTWHWPERA